ncbi:unnamed protein product [Ceutorhynchus assimilis]|uniref:Oxidative stress-induced growth inhibitor 2 n=1 Tax=Ceutorhynchus assimilis TaxID=467358 RepID=A0A9N9QF65_9CUCU|nr:unnamed protein product [Ceutorhynchus assimilis]
MDTNAIYKEVVVIGNGPSGIIVSLMLSGKLPYFITSEHPDEMLNARLKSLTSPCLISQNLEFLAQGLEGRCNNPISLLMDALLHPYADLGIDLEPLIEFRQTGKEIDHVVLGRGPPGGSWHRIDPDVLTLSLGSWMALPGLPFPSCTTNEKRAYSRDVATYYENYVRHMGLDKYFINDTLATSVISCSDRTVSEELLLKKKNWIKRFDRNVVDRVKDYFEPVNEDGNNNCFISNALNCLLSSSSKRTRLSKRPKTAHDNIAKKLNQNKSEPIFVPKHERKRSISCCCCCGDTENYKNPKTFPHSQSLDASSTKPVPFYNKINCDSNDKTPNWIIQTTNAESGETTKYSCKYLVLACGTYDSPNRLEIFKSGPDPDWLVHDLRSLESKLDNKAIEDGSIIDPVLIVGAGLSAADAIMAVRSRNVPVIHVFRRKSAEFTRQLPENMYPEYHKVRQMMNDGGSTYPLYKAYSEHSLTGFDAKSQTIKLTSSSGEDVKVKVSFAAVLIGSRPSLSFLPNNMNLGIFPDRDIDSKTNPVDVNPITHEVMGHEGLFAVGPLAGDNFVRYIPGGAVAAVAELYKKWNLIDAQQ